MRKIQPFAKSNPETPHSEHRKQTFQQIFLPLLIFSLVMAAMAVLAGLTTRTSAAEGASLASIALIFMLIPIMLVGLLGLLVLSLLIFGIQKLTSALPTYTLIGQYYFSIAACKVKMVSDRIIIPFLRIKEYWAGWLAFLDHLHYSRPSQ